MRAARKRSESDVYHVVARGTGRQIIFEDDEDRLKFLDLLDTALADSTIVLFAWCLMSNHVHLLFRAPLEEVSALMRRLLGSYALYFNAKSGRVGHLFQERFSSEPVDSDSYLLTVIRYIHQNPVKAGLSTVEEWCWSSYGEYIAAPKRCSTEFVLGVFGGRGPFEDFHAVPGSENCLDVRTGRSATRGFPDDVAARVAQEALGDVKLDELKALAPTERNAHLASLKAAGVTVKQIERLTGIGRGAVQRAVSNPPVPLTPDTGHRAVSNPPSL